MVQLLSSIHQAQIENGNWENSIHLLPFQDPVSRILFGGTECELETIFNYREPLQKLRKSQGSEGGDANGDGKGEGKRSKKWEKKGGDGDAGA